MAGKRLKHDNFVKRRPDPVIISQDDIDLTNYVFVSAVFIRDDDNSPHTWSHTDFKVVNKHRATVTLTPDDASSNSRSLAGAGPLTGPVTGTLTIQLQDSTSAGNPPENIQATATVFPS